MTPVGILANLPATAPLELEDIGRVGVAEIVVD